MKFYVSLNYCMYLAAVSRVLLCNSLSNAVIRLIISGMHNSTQDYIEPPLYSLK